MVAVVVVSGALHQDALADTADGLGVHGDRVRRLAMMRDSATGAFGVLALIGWALLLFTALEPLGADHALRALIVAGAVGPVRGVVALAACGLAAILSAALARRTIGGSTGDTLGAAVAVTEVAVCLALMAMSR
jgi:adenosylcobinamide-GDP ribazoletransferase